MEPVLSAQKSYGSIILEETTFIQKPTDKACHNFFLLGLHGIDGLWRYSTGPMHLYGSSVMTTNKTEP